MAVQQHAVRRLDRLLLLTLALAMGACAQEGGRSGYLGYLKDRDTRRQALLSALWYRDNDYARLRLSHFATQGDDSWDRLPIFLPRVAPLRGRPAGPEIWQELDAVVPDAPDAEAAQVEGALFRLGQAAFFNYPAQLVDGFELALSSKATQEAYGLWYGRVSVDDPALAPRLSGLLRVGLPSGGTALSLSCSTCHAGPFADPGADLEQVVPGRANQRLDIGLLAQDQAPAGTTLPAAKWGPGRVSVSPEGLGIPANIPDLRAIFAQTYLHHDATLHQQDVFSLAVRIETLLLTNLRGVAPPPAVALGLAVYLRTLRPPASPAASIDSHGAGLFATHCAGCHSTPDHGGEPVALSTIGTDPALGRSPERGTGTYRVPTLLGVASRGSLLHDGRIPDVGALLDPARLTAGYRNALHGDGPVLGHVHGLELDPQDRADLTAFVSSL